jgi:hypothetical protein
MRNKLIGIFVSLFLVIFSATEAFSQTNNNVEMADGMRTSGKIYVVIAVILTILTGLILYVIRIDRKLTRLEKEPS